MTRPSRFHTVCTGLAAGVLTAAVTVAALSLTPVAASGQAAPQIPGITTKDAFPNGCVDCHTANSKAGDTRISALMAKWTSAVEPSLLAKAKASAADPAKVKGKHPPMPKPGANIPQGCLSACHKKGSVLAPAFATLMHNVHFTGTPNQFLSVFGGECTHCHKLDPKTGAFRIPSAPEK